jgi:hypothetical protein
VLSTDEWIKKMQYIGISEYYLAIRKNEIMLVAGKQMKLEIVRLNKINWVQNIYMCLCVKERERGKMNVNFGLFGGNL